MSDNNMNIDPNLVINELLDQIKQLTADKALLQAAVNQLTTAINEMQSEAEEVDSKRTRDAVIEVSETISAEFRDRISIIKYR